MFETDVSGSDVSKSDVFNRIMFNLDGLNMDDIEVGELCDSNDSERRIVGLDGYFLKGCYGGYLLASVGIDANNCIYPIAYVDVKSENQASWLWFLELLAIDLEIVSSYQISFMSDKQKELLEVIYMLLPNMILEERGNLILTIMEVIRTKIMLLIVKKKEEAKKWKGMLCLTIRKMLDVNIKNSLRCVPSHAVGDRYQVECGPGKDPTTQFVNEVSMVDQIR
ncbi:hypothetical protein PVK06_008588 [Gossypium arboreum]|uniref:MULE transposase domain-containing protein n=1 Tax=Gossypium arboreum TaxID=29729 RepID=A0ABR0QL23_GOSAR|nr:hypothetical protein PVK06_008588 [Gossypium arboreum]